MNDGYSVGVPVLMAGVALSVALAGGLYLVDGHFWMNLWQVGTLVMGAGILSASRAAFRAGQRAAIHESDKSVESSSGVTKD